MLLPSARSTSTAGNPSDSVLACLEIMGREGAIRSWLDVGLGNRRRAARARSTSAPFLIQRPFFIVVVKLQIIRNRLISPNQLIGD
jgi:hypothetical protein